MDKNKILDELKVSLKLIKQAFSTTDEVVTKFTDEKLDDGLTIISYEADELSVGLAVMVITEQGKMIMPDGDYKTADGDTFTIAGGIVKEVVLVPIEEEVVPSNDAPAPNPAQTMDEAQAKSIIESIVTERHFASEDFVSAKFDELAKLISEGKDTTTAENFATQKENTEKELKELKEKYTNLETQFNKSLELIEKIAELPSVAPVEQTPAKTKFNLREHQTNFKRDLQEIFDNTNK